MLSLRKLTNSLRSELESSEPTIKYLWYLYLLHLLRHPTFLLVIYPNNIDEALLGGHLIAPDRLLPLGHVVKCMHWWRAVAIALLP